MTDEVGKLPDVEWHDLKSPRWQWLSSTYELQSETYEYPLTWFSQGLRLGSSAVIKELAGYIDWNMTAAGQELAEARVEFSWKPWATDAPFVNKERLLDELVDVNHFIGNILVAMGVTDEEYAAAYQRKQQKNRDRAASGTYSAKKGSLGEGSNV
jgi:hypothetical protein